MDIKQLRAKMTPESDGEQSTRRPTMPARDSSDSRLSTGQKVLAAAVLGLGLYLRRRSKSSTPTVSDGGDSQSVEREDPDAGGSKGRSLARRLAMTVITTLAISLARRAYRRVRGNR